MSDIRPALELDDRSSLTEVPPWKEFARAPLTPVALAGTLGLVADRNLGVPLEAWFALIAIGCIGWFPARWRASPAAWPMLWLAVVGVVGARHQTYLHSFAPDDVGEFVTDTASIVRLRGVLATDPLIQASTQDDPLEATYRPGQDFAELRVTAIAAGDRHLIPLSGLTRLIAQRDAGPAGRSGLHGLHAGDAIELVGRLTAVRPRGNPGERDFARELRDRRIRSEIQVSDSTQAITRLQSGEWTGEGIVATLRRRASATLRDHLPPREAGVAQALLLGDGTAMERAEWDAYIRTGVVHALAISGQHLAVLAGFLWLGARILGARQARAAWLILTIIVGYTVLTGMRPSGLRAMVMVAAVCGAFVLRRPVFAANGFALSWLVVMVVNPTDPFTLGCWLSFLSVFVLVWFAGRLLHRKPMTPLERLVEESRPVSVRILRGVVKVTVTLYAISLIIAAVNAPLIIARQNLVSPVGVLIGPPVVVCTSVALISGFMLLLFSPLGPVVTPLVALTRWSLVACECIVDLADRIPGGAVYTPGVPTWWLIFFYAGLLMLVLSGKAWRTRTTLGLLGWTVLGLALPPQFGSKDHLQVTFLAVGHGSCTVIEAPDGRCLVYDAGATAGPGIVRRVIAPYLWSRGIRRIDELFLSHADSDHFNGVTELLRRFSVGQVTLTPSFAEKPALDVASVLVALDQYDVPRRIAVVGDRFEAGNISVEVLHPPPYGPAGVENERSLVLQVHHAGHTILLTGDLEKSGTSLLLRQRSRPCDLLVAPHHGSEAAFPKELADWCRPRLVVVSRGNGPGSPIGEGIAGPGVPVWDTVAKGAVTVRSHQTGLVVESYRTGETVVLVRGG